MKVHLDTDLGGDIDDLCALALLLNWQPQVELTGITTVAELGGRRAGYAKYALKLAGRQSIPVAAGADCSTGFYPCELGLPDEARYWPEPVPPSPNPPEIALELLKQSIEQGAAIIAIGPYTNLYLLDQAYPGILSQARLFLMGGYIYPVRPGYPQWGNDMDFNVQVDVRSAYHVLLNANRPTLVPLSVTVETALCFSHLPALRQAGSLAQLIARQAVAFAEDERNAEKFIPTCPNLPADFINFQHDPLAVAIALGWREGIEIQELPLAIEVKDGLLHESIDPRGKWMSVATQIDGPSFDNLWLNTVTRLM